MQNKPPAERVVVERLDPRKATKKRISLADYKKKIEVEVPRTEAEEVAVPTKTPEEPKIDPSPESSSDAPEVISAEVTKVS